MINKNQLLTRLSMVGVAIVVTACGSSGGDGVPVAGAASATIFGQITPAEGSPYVGITDGELGGLADVPVTATGLLQVPNDFTFATSRQATVRMSVPEVANATAEATFCTDYSFDGDNYKVNYDSCILHATMHGGELREEINLVNQHSSVLGVVWQQGPDAKPIYQEFKFD